MYPREKSEQQFELIWLTWVISIGMAKPARRSRTASGGARILKQPELERVERTAVFVVRYTQPHHRLQRKVAEKQNSTVRVLKLEEVHLSFIAGTSHIAAVQHEVAERHHRLVLVPYRDDCDPQAVQVDLLVV